MDWCCIVKARWLAQLAGSSAVVLLGCIFGGCAPAGPSPQASLPAVYKAQFDQALADPNLSSFQRQVLSDYQITDAEYQEAVSRYTQCMANDGWQVTFDPSGGHSTVALPGHAWDQERAAADDTSCSNDSTSYVMTIYYQLKNNPQGLNQAGLVRACFQKNGILDASNLSDDLLQQELVAGTFRASTPQGILCVWDPTGSQHLTIAQAEAMDAAQAQAPQGGSMTTNSDGSVTVTYPDGSQKTFPRGPDGSVVFVDPNGNTATIKPCPAGSTRC